MSPFGRLGLERRNYTKGEIQTLKNLLGYTIKFPYSTSHIITNQIPWSSRMSSTNYSTMFSLEAKDIFHEKLKADTSINNDSGVFWKIVLRSDTTLHDADGDTIKIYPNSIVNFRGAGKGGNNHNCLSVNSAGTEITYVPRPDFTGRCQFGFNLWDGKEKGAFVLYTIDVFKGNKVKAKAGEELVMNGDFEEGSEVKLRHVNEDVNNSSFYKGVSGRIYGAHFADSHPFDYWTYGFMPYGGGLSIRNAYSDCDTTGILKEGFGTVGNSFPSTKLFKILPAKDSGDRYQMFLGSTYGFYNLKDSLRNCHKYNLSLDVYTDVLSAPIFDSLFKITFGFTDTGKLKLGRFDWIDYTSKMGFFDFPANNFKLLPYTSFPIKAGWQHIEVPFLYCGSSPSDMLVIKMDTLNISLSVDNISIKEDTTKLNVLILDSIMTTCSNIRLYAKVNKRTINSCTDTYSKPIKYFWTKNGDTISTDSAIYILPKDTNKYFVTVFNGCEISKDSISFLPTFGPEVIARDTFICQGDVIGLPITVKGTTGTVSYSWTPTTGLSCSTCLSPSFNPSATTTYILTVTDSLSCFKQPLTITVFPKVDFKVDDDTICYGGKAELRVDTKLRLKYLWTDSTLSCDTCDIVSTPFLTTPKIYTVKATNSIGCTAFDTVVISLFPKTTIVTKPSDTTMCLGDSVSLNASGLKLYNWLPADFASCIMCSTTKVSPTSTMVYTIGGVDSNNCIANSSVIVRVNPLPNIVALPMDTAICGAGYITLSATGAFTYAWAPAAGISSSTAAITAAFVSGSTKYFVTGVDTNGCIGKDSVDVTVNPKPTITVTTPFVNLCAPDSVTLSVSGAASYLWTPSTGGIACSTCATTKALPTSFPITYTVTATDTNECTSIATVYASLVTCACSPTSVFGTSATTLSTATLPTTLGSGYYYLPNNLNINSNTVMTGAKILIERGVTITVANNAKLTLDSCHLFTCDDDTSKAMWQGIVLASGATSSGRIEVKNNTLLEDAMFAIDANTIRTPTSGNVIDVSNSTFNRNQVDISMKDYKVISPAILPISIKGNLFTARKFSRTTMTGYPNTWLGTATLKAASAVTDSKPSYYINKTPALSKVKCKDTNIFSYIGVRTNEIGLTSTAGVYQSEIKIGEGAAIDDYNLFDNHAYGFVSYNSNVSLFHNHFINISRRMTPSTSTTIPVENGMAVLLQSTPTNNNRAQVTYGSNLFNQFHDCFMGIYSENIATLDIRGTKITSSNTAGAVVAGAAYLSEIYAGYGMMLHCDGIQKNNIIGNTISNINVGIQINMVNPKAGVVTNISGNTLRAQNPDPLYASYLGKQYMSKAIDAYSSGGVKGTANTMTINDNTLSKVFNGISFQGLKNIKCSTTNNTITLWDTITPVSSSVQYGIQANSNNEATISGNTISSVTVALTADRVRGVKAGFNTSLRICGNTTNNIGRGFEFASGADQTGTRWIGNTMNNGYKGMVLASNIGDQGFTYNWVTMPWTYWGATLNKWNIVGSSNYHTYIEGAIKSSSSKLYVRNIPTGIVELPSTNWGSPPTFRYLYTGTPTGTIQIGQQESNCLGSILPTKYNPIPKGGLTGVKTLGLLIMADSLGYDSTYNVRQWMSQLSLYELGTIDPELRDSSAALDSFMNEAASSRFAWLTDIEKAINNDDFSTAQNLLDNPVSAMGRVVVNGDLIITDYTDANEVVENYTNYYHAYLQFLQGTMTDSDSARIWSIAHKCPVKDGAVVYKARALQQRLSFDFIVYNDDSCEYNNGSNYRIAPDATITGGEGNNAYTLFPNPNNGSFVIKQSIAENKAVNLKVYNAIGSLVYQSKATFVNGQISVKLGQKAQGVYLVCIGDDKERTTCLRFIIN